MNRNRRSYSLANLMVPPEGWGRALGQRIAVALKARIEEGPADELFCLSLKNVRQMDVTFAGVVIAGTVKHYLGAKGICLTDLADLDLAENIAAAAHRAGVPIAAWNGQVGQILGPAPTAGTRDALAFAMERPDVRARDVAEAHKLSVANASTKLKQLWEQGYLLRGEGSAPSGGTEYVYCRIG
jgi:hypothetical protein